MSGKKVSDTKIQEDDNTDSGFLSGPLSEQLLSSDDLVADDCDSKTVVSETDHQLDSGVDLCLSECLSKVKLVDTATAQTPSIRVDHAQDIPIDIFFQPDNDGDTQLHIAAVHGCVKSVATLISICPNKAWLDFPNEYYHTALHLAAMSGDAVVTRMLVRAGASTSERDSAGETPLHIATAAGHVECMQALLATVPEHRPRTMAAVLNQKNYNGQTCVHIAATAGNLEALQTLVYYGADINAREGLAGWTALHIAVRRGDARLCQYLVERCPGVSAATRDYAGRTPRRLAARTPLAHLFSRTDDSDTDSDSDDDIYDSESESLFEKLKVSMNAINVA